MAVRVTCPACEASFSVGDNMRGKRVPCRECKKSVSVPAAKRRNDEEDDDLDEAIQVKGGKKPSRREEEDEKEKSPKRGGPQKKVRPPALDDDEDEEDEDDDEESPRRKKKGASPMVWLGGGVGVLVLLLAVLFFFMRSGGDKKGEEIAENNSPTPQQNDPTKPPENPPATNPNEPKKEPDPQDPKTNPDLKKEEPKKEEPKKEPVKTPSLEPKKEPVPPLIASDPGSGPAPIGAAMSGEKVYQRLIKSTVWIIAPQAKPIMVKVIQGGGGPNPAPMGGLVGTSWAGKESLSGYSDIKFQFVGPDRVIMFDRDGAQPGTYKLADPTNVTLNFYNGAVVYTGAIKDTVMTGTAKNDKESWTWETTKQEAPALAVTEIPIKTTATGTGALVDRKHRLVLTNCHVVGDPENLQIYFPTEQSGELKVQRDYYKSNPGIKAKVVMREERCDLALVQLEELPSTVQVLPMARVSAKPAQNVHSLGNPAASRALWIYSPGRVRQVYKDTWKILDGLQGKVITFDGMKIETDSPINPGDSGGPLVNDHAVLVGVAHGGNIDAQNISYFIDVSECRGLLQKYYQSLGETYIPEPEPVTQEALAKVPDLIRKLERQDFATRLVAVQTLGGMGGEASLAFQPLWAALKREEDPVVRNALDEAIEKIPPRPGDLDMLLEICKDNLISTKSRQQAVRAVSRLGPQGKPAIPVLFDLIRDGDLELQRLALLAVGNIGPESKDVSNLAPALKSTNLAVARQAVETVGKIGPDAKAVVPQMVTLLKKNDRELKLKVLQTLQNIGPAAAKDGAPYLNELLKENDPDLGGPIAVTLVRLGDTKHSVPYLVAQMKTGPVPYRRNMINFLAQLGPDARTATTDLLTTLDEDPLHEDAKKALIKIGRTATKSVCIKMVKSNNAKVRLACIHIVGEIRFNSPEVVQALQYLAQVEPVPENKAAALKTLEKITGGL